MNQKGFYSRQGQQRIESSINVGPKNARQAKTRLEVL